MVRLFAAFIAMLLAATGALAHQTPCTPYDIMRTVMSSPQFNTTGWGQGLTGDRDAADGRFELYKNPQGDFYVVTVTKGMACIFFSAHDLAPFRIEPKIVGPSQ